MTSTRHWAYTANKTRQQTEKQNEDDEGEMKMEGGTDMVGEMCERYCGRGEKEI